MTRGINMVRNLLALALMWGLAGGQLGCGLEVGGIECGDESCLPAHEQSSPNTYTCACSCKPNSTVYDMRVKASADDVEQKVSTGAMNLIGTVLDIPWAGGTNQLIGLRFTDLAIPQGAHIVSAQLQFTAAADAAEAVSVTIVGEASDNAPTFISTAKNLSSRQFTNSAVPWSPLGWKKDDQGLNEQAPGLGTIVQEIVNRPGWVPGNAMVLMIKNSSGTGSRPAYSYDKQPENAVVLAVTFDDPAALTIGPQEMPVCMPPSLNANLGGQNPQSDDLINDCQYRVGATFTGLAEACNYPANCGCVAVPDSKTYSAKCDDPCVENPLASECTNFDPKNDVVEATNAPGDPAVCMANCPLSFGMFGRRSECLVEGTAQMSIAGEQIEPSVTGTVQFRGAACREGNCAIGMEYDLDIADVRFETLFGSELFEELTGIGESIPGNEAVLSHGRGTFAAGDLLTSARGRRGRTQQALTTPNLAPVNIDVAFGSTAPTCAIRGAMVGGSDASGAPKVAMGLDLRGAIVNQPPTAAAGKDQVMQCPATVALDGSASSDPDGNIAVYSWIRGGRAGRPVGSQKVSTVEQRPGKETYVLRVIDTRGQTDEDTTDVTVVDSTAPRVKCGVRTAVFTAPTRAMADVGFSSTARDACEGTLPVKVDIFSDEVGSARTRDGKPSPDAQIAPGSLQLRQDRRADGDGRVYLIRVAASDSSGNQGLDCCTVVVPRDSSRKGLLAAAKQATAARSLCLAGHGAVPSGFVPVGDSVKTGK